MENEYIKWIDRNAGKYGLKKELIEQLIKEQDGKCAITGVKMKFDRESGTALKNGEGCHPLYASIDHKSPMNKHKTNLEKDDIQLIC